MASLVLSAAGGAVGGALFGPAGAFAGRLVGAIGGSDCSRAPQRRRLGCRKARAFATST
jgi:hypothetical protein